MTNETIEQAEPKAGSLPEENVDVKKMQGHWLLAKMGKRVLRPGGLELTKQMLSALTINQKDEVVEFAPGFGVTAKITLKKNPAHYTAIEKEKAAAEQLKRYLNGDNQICKVGSAEATGIPNQYATVVYGEAMLTMQKDSRKSDIIREAARILKPGGRYAIHEVGIIPDDISPELKQQIQRDLSHSIHISALPVTISEWKALLENEGLQVEKVLKQPFHLLEPLRLVQDEGIVGALRFTKNLMGNKEAREVIMQMKAVFRKHRANLCGISIIAKKPEQVLPSSEGYE